MKSRENASTHENNPENTLQNEPEQLERAKKWAIKKAASEVLEGAGVTS